SSGLLGSALVPYLTGSGHFVVRLVRNKPDRDRGDIVWDPVSGKIERTRLEGFDAVVHLAGENIARRRWSRARKARILSSRVQGTEFLAQTLAGLQNKPRVLVSASGIGYYGNRPGHVVREETPAGTGFLAELCQEWERSTQIADTAKIRVVQMRFGIVLSPRGGALRTMLGPFRLGLGGPFGSGRQFMSWIAIDDALAAILRAIEDDKIRGPVNAVAPQPVTNAEFTRTLGRVLARPALLPAPAFALRLALGELADEGLLSSCQAVPGKLSSAGFKFEYPDLEEALRRMLS
ncbi:MAG TPA: TIGR01777 family oxidoreductase, partial [Kiritimatiellia bacterium]